MAAELNIKDGPRKPDLELSVSSTERHLHLNFATGRPNVQSFFRGRSESVATCRGRPRVGGARRAMSRSGAVYRTLVSR